MEKHFRTLIQDEEHVTLGCQQISDCVCVVFFVFSEFKRTGRRKRTSQTTGANSGKRKSKSISQYLAWSKIHHAKQSQVV